MRLAAQEMGRPGGAVFPVQPDFTWTNYFWPNRKFSGKERDDILGLDDFGARYYAWGLYRFISTDPVLDLPGAIENPQKWNRYAYCLNNPITKLDPDGLDPMVAITRPAQLYEMAQTINRSMSEIPIIGPAVEFFFHLPENAFEEGQMFRGVISGIVTGWTAPAVKTLDKLGIKYTQHFARRLSGRIGRGISAEKALEAYNEEFLLKRHSKHIIREDCFLTEQEEDIFAIVQEQVYPLLSISPREVR